ncbi:MAG: hypothetical protein SFU98_16445 [Leptospiraceae bacterium]|nr:hypothetical protein [Leptospiraceae bacterium]
MKLFPILLFFCFSIFSNDILKKNSPEVVTVKLGKVFKTDSFDSKNSEKEIISLLQVLVDGTIQKNLNRLKYIVHPQKGIYLDLKGEWSYKNLLQELSKEDSYFEIYFFNKEKLQKQKESLEVETVRELLLKTKGITADLFFEKDSSCEVKLKFNENKNREFDLNNPYFIKIDGKWYLYRLF